MRWERVRQQNQLVGLTDSSSGPGKRWGHTCNAIKGGRFLYVFGGFCRDGGLTNQVHVFDAETQIWTQPVISGVPPCPRDSHTCTTVGDNLFVFGGINGTNYLKDLHILDTSSHTWICPDVRGEGPVEREGHSATLVDKRLFIFGGCGKSSSSDDEVFYNDLYILNTETFVWKHAVTAGNPPSARDNHTCSTWKNKIIVVGGEDLNDYYLSDVHILDTDTFVWKELKTSGQLLTPRAGHVTVAFERNLFVFGGFTNSQNLYDDLYVLDVETGIWSKVVAMEEGPSARFSTAGVCLDPYKPGLFFFVGGCNKNLEPLDDIYYLHTEGGYAQLNQNSGRLSLKKQMKLKCKDQSDVAGTNIDQGRENQPLYIGPSDQRKMFFQARVTENVPIGYTIETTIGGKLLRGVLFSTRHGFGQTADPSISSMKRHAMIDGDYDDRAKRQRTLDKDSAGSSQQANPIDLTNDDADKVADSNDMDTPMFDTNMARPQEAETIAVTSDIKDQDASKLVMGVTDTEPSQATDDQATVEPSKACSNQQADPIDLTNDDANKVADSNDMNTPMLDTNMARPQEAETDVVTPDVKDQDATKLVMGVTDTEPSLATDDQANIEPSKAGSSQQADHIDLTSDDANKVADSNDVDTPMLDSNMARPQEAETVAVTPDVKNQDETVAVTSDVKDQDDSKVDMGVTNTEASQVTNDQANVEPSNASSAGDSSQINQDEGTVAVEDANTEQQ